jgi:hypothetical protein
MTQYHQVRILLAVARRQWEDLERLVGREAADPDRFPELCRASDVHPWVHLLLAETDRRALFAESLLLELERLRSKVRHDNLLLLGRAEQAVRLLTDAGVVPVALKGLDFLHRLYDRFDQRTIDDVDLLIRPRDLRRCLEVLEAAGWTPPPEPGRTHYVRSSHHLPLVSPGPVRVDFEVHWSLAQDIRYHIDVDGLFERAVPIELGGRRILRLEDHDAVAHLLIHHFSHYFDRRLKWLVDLQALSLQVGFEWSRVVERIRCWRATAAAAVSLRHLHKLSPDLIPAEALRELPLALWRRAFTAPLRSSHPLELFRFTDRRSVQLYLAAVMLEQPTELPGWLVYRVRRDRRTGENPLDSDLTPAAHANVNADGSGD